MAVVDREDRGAVASVGLAAGYKLDAEEIIEAKVMDITPEFIGEVRAHGFKDLSMEQLIQLKNAGSLAHNLKLTRSGETLGGTPTFPGGETRSGRVNLEPGRYEMVCTVGDHAELGMRGDFEVK